MLVIEVEYLLGRVYAADFRDNAEPEWPPHPARLFSALVAAYHDANGTEQEREALLWLERQPPPQIAAQEAGRADAVVTFVPTNYAGKSGSTHPEQRGKQARSFPAQGPEPPIVHFVWPGTEAPPQHTAALKHLTTRVGSLGRACSLVRVCVINATEEPLDFRQNYKPDDSGKEVMTVAGAGRLEELERTFELGRRPTQGALQRYRRADNTKTPGKAVHGHFGEIVVLRRKSGIGFPIESTTMLTRLLREAFLSRAGGGRPLSPMLSGHDGDTPSSGPHVAFAALPNVGYENSDGRLMGLALILPVSITKADRVTALRAFASIESINLGPQLGEWAVEIADFDVIQWTLKKETWLHPSRQWQTVTPILLDRYPKKNLSSEELLVTACVRAGLPVPVRCKYGRFSDLRGVAPVSAFAPSRWGIHATIEFSVPVIGPVLVGAGRFFGMGLMKPVKQPANEGNE